MPIRFHTFYFTLTVFVFIMEVMIALFIKDTFIRPYVGDVLVVILIYCFVQSFFKVQVLPLAISVLIFSFIIEFLQYFNIVEKLGWESSALANTLIGNSYAWKDLLAYLAGILMVLLLENVNVKKGLYER